LAATSTTPRAPGAARRRAFHPPWLAGTFGLSSRHRKLRRSAPRVSSRSWLTVAKLARCTRRPHRSASALFLRPPFAIIVAPCALTTRSTRTPTGGASRLGGRRLPWFVRAHGEYTPRSTFSSASSGGTSQVVARAWRVVLASALGVAHDECTASRDRERFWLTGPPELRLARSRMPTQRASGHSSVVARGRVLRPGARDAAGLSMAKVCLPTLRWRRRALRPNHAVNPDAPSAWLLLACECAHHRIVARHAGAPVTLVR
jgi:hypothetical protein